MSNPAPSATQSQSPVQRINNNVIVAIIGVLAGVAAICGCCLTGFIFLKVDWPQIYEESLKEQIVGTWQDADGKTMTFFKDNRYQSGGPIPVPGTYMFLDGNHIRIDVIGLAQVYKIKVSGNTLTLIDEGKGISISMTRIK